MALMPSQCPEKTDSKFCPCWQTGVGVGRRLPRNNGQGTSIHDPVVRLQVAEALQAGRGGRQLIARVVWLNAKVIRKSSRCISDV